jgi:hypothetical protein
MDRETLDKLWQIAMRQSIEDGEQFTRYHFAKLVAEHEHKAIIKALKKQQKIFMSNEYSVGQPLSSFKERFAVGICIREVELRGQS